MINNDHGNINQLIFDAVNEFDYDDIQILRMYIRSHQYVKNMFLFLFYQKV